jgi:hypothetical protein
MTETKTQELDWDEYDATEEITKEDQKSSESMERTLLIGKFVCEVVGVTLKEASFYTGLQVDLKMRIDHVMEFQQAVKNTEGEPVMRKDKDGIEVALEKVLPIAPELQDEMNALVCGQHIFDQIKYPEEDEKGSAKRRRLFVAKQLGLIDKKATEMALSVWKTAVGVQVAVDNERNAYFSKKQDKDVVNAQVAYGGYTSLEDAGFDPELLNVNDDDFDDI